MELVGEQGQRRIRDRDEERAVGERADREGGDATRELLADEHRGAYSHLGLGELHERQRVLLRHELRDLQRRHELALDESLAQPLPRDALVRDVTLLCEHGLELLPGDETVTHEERPERRPRVESGLHVLDVSAGGARSVRAARILSCVRFSSG